MTIEELNQNYDLNLLPQDDFQVKGKTIELGMELFKVRIKEDNLTFLEKSTELTDFIDKAKIEIDVINTVWQNRWSIFDN